MWCHTQERYFFYTTIYFQKMQKVDSFLAYFRKKSSFLDIFLWRYTIHIMFWSHPRLTTLGLLTLIGASSSLSVLILLFYTSPERNLPLMLTLMVVSLVLALTSYLAIVIYFLKKLYYRGAINASLIYTSLRHAFFLVIYACMIRIFDYYWVLIWQTALLFGFVLLFLEATISQISSYE